LANDAGVDRAYLSRVERALTYVGLEIIEKLPRYWPWIQPSFSGSPAAQGSSESRLKGRYRDAPYAQELANDLNERVWGLVRVSRRPFGTNKV
jgi:hypothetical protein